MGIVLVMGMARSARAGEQWEYGTLETHIRVVEKQPVVSFLWTTRQGRKTANDVDQEMAKFYKDVTGDDWVDHGKTDAGEKLAVLMDGLGRHGWELVGFQIQQNVGVYMFKRRVGSE